MNRDEVKARIIELVNNQFKTDTATESTRLIEDLAGTSIDEAEITMTLEDELHIDLYSNTNVKRIKTVGQLIDMVFAKF